ncbi:MAG: methyltransferase domain-containing protein [Alphaproteobacteria bacterium]|nr:MAG: methyltransferase domain-containing protein [Alphaproteobacteria bacterium]
MDPHAITTAYARWAPVYDRTFGAITHAGRRRAVGRVNRRPGRVLEIGVGTGLALPLYDRRCQVTGIDFSADMLARARRRVARERLDHVAGLVRMDARALAFPDASFDWVVAMHVLSVVPEPERVMAEIARVCRPGGRVVVTNHFSAERGPLRLAERLLDPLGDRLGWHPDFPLERILAPGRLEPVHREPLPPLGMMTLIEFTRLP